MRFYLTTLLCFCSIFSQLKAEEAADIAPDCYPLPCREFQNQCCPVAMGINQPKYFIEAAFLYWYARETNLSYALQMVGEKSPEQSGLSDRDTYALPTKYHDLDTHWAPGVRVGIGFDKCNCWDVKLKWTYYHNDKKNSSSVIPPVDSMFIEEPGQTMLLNPWVDLAVFNGLTIAGTTHDANNYFQRVAAQWNLNYNVIDFEIGQKFCPTCCFSIRPFAGIRGAFTKTSFETISTLGPGSLILTNNATRLNAKDLFTNKVWGVGLLAGMEPSWNFCSNFFLFGDLDAALIWGKFRGNKNMRYLVTDMLADGTPVNLTNIKHKAHRD